MVAVWICEGLKKTGGKRRGVEQTGYGADCRQAEKTGRCKTGDTGKGVRRYRSRLHGMTGKG